MSANIIADMAAIMIANIAANTIANMIANMIVEYCKRKRGSVLAASGCFLYLFTFWRDKKMLRLTYHNSANS